MPILKAPPKQIRNATIQVRVEEEVDLKLRKYAEYIGSTPAFVVAESLKLLFHKDTDFREWLAHHDDAAGHAKGDEPTVHEQAPEQDRGQTLFHDETKRTVR